MGLWQCVWESARWRAQGFERQEVGCYITRSNLVPLKLQVKDEPLFGHRVSRSLSICPCEVLEGGCGSFCADDRTCSL